MTKTESLTAATSRINWSLWVGAVLVALTLFLALFGPSLAPADPLKENFVVIRPRGGGFVKPPLAPFAEVGFPLGADEYGRDILSRLLWAVRPTLTLVLVVAAIRLSLGLLVGLISGWVAGGVGRALDTAITIAVSIPVLFVALLIIAATGQRWGVWAFIVGLSVTGWAEVARIVREQTRLVKGQRYVEAARALGLSGAQVVIRHVLPQLLPVLWVLLALEASSALLTTAGLGLLGYFVNAVWLPHGDFSGIRAAGKPELGQMLAFSGPLHQPWSALMAGTLVLLIVLGFNLFSEGLRLALSPGRQRRPNWLTRRAEAVSASVSDRLFLSMAEWQRTLSTSGAMAALMALIVGGGWWLWAQTAQASANEAAIAVPGGHAWASLRHDPQGTLYTTARGPEAPEIAWTFSEPEGLFPPVIAADGTVYLLSARDGGTLVALNPDGSVRWQSAIPEAVFGPPGEAAFDRPPVHILLSVPALNPEGEIIVSDGEGHLYTFTPEGGVRWRRVNPNPAGLIAQPIVGADGMIYLATEQDLIAVSVDGQRRWQVGLPTYSYSQPVLRLTADARYLLFQDRVVDTRTGAEAFSAPTSLDFFVVGADGKLYVRKQSGLEEWQVNDTEAQVIPRIRLDARGLGLNFGLSSDGGVAPSGWVWFQYAAPFGGPSRVVWADANGQVENINSERNGGRIVAIDGDLITYVCDAYPSVDIPAGCSAYQQNGLVRWEFGLEDEFDFVLGGALTEGRLYLASAHGALYALGQGNVVPSPR